MGALKTSEQGDAVAGEGNKDPAVDDRPVDTGAKIIIGPGTIDPAPAAAPARTAPSTLPPRPQRPSQMPLPEPRTSGLGLIVLLYVLSAAALGFAIYERFVA
ncbi:MAG TPA: hypothetical protein VIV40_32395 [Kofleriaceae bacterium]